MTRDEFLQSSLRVRHCGMLFGAACVIALGPIIAHHSNAAIDAAEQYLLARLPAGLVQVSVSILCFAALGLVVIAVCLPFILMDRWFGRQCPGCGRSITLRCHRKQVLESGRCCRCRELLFEFAEVEFD